MKLVPKVLGDVLIRRKAALHRVPMDRFTLRVARTVEEYAAAFGLVQVGYKFQGIERIDAGPMRITEQHVLPEATVLVAYEGDQCVGTITITMDSPAGLPLDADYPKELRNLRRHDRRLVEIGSLAVARRCWRSGVAPLLSLMASRVAYGWLGAHQTVIGVHPNAAAMYRALWGYEPIGVAVQHASLIAPTWGLMSERQRVLRHFNAHMSRPLASGHTMRAHVFENPAPPCFSGSERPQAREKMPREVFQELFLRRSGRMASLTNDTRLHLRRQRSDATLELGGSGTRLTSLGTRTKEIRHAG